jgi:predicted metal-binding membrane protein
MTGMAMGGGGGTAMAPALPMMVLMMAAMMLPSAVPAIAHRNRDGRAATLASAFGFAFAYLAVWALVAVAIWAVYAPPSDTTAGALLLAAGGYELTPLKRKCRRRCRERVRSGVRYGVYCLGSSVGLMLVLVAVDVMSVPLMVAIAGAVLAQKLYPPIPAVDVPIALATAGAGLLLATL